MLQKILIFFLTEKLAQGVPLPNVKNLKFLNPKIEANKVSYIRWSTWCEIRVNEVGSKQMSWGLSFPWGYKWLETYERPICDLCSPCPILGIWFFTVNPHYSAEFLHLFWPSVMMLRLHLLVWSWAIPIDFKITLALNVLVPDFF